MHENTVVSVALIGDEPLLIECGRLLQSERFQIELVVSDDDRVKAWAGDLAVDAGLLGSSHPLYKRNYDFLLSIGNQRVLPAELLSSARLGAVNFHDGPLPRYAGLFTTSWTIINGESTHGVTWHTMSEHVDEGMVLASRDFPLSDADSAQSLNAKCFDLGLEAFQELLPKLKSGELTGDRVDSASKVLYLRKQLPQRAGEIDGRSPAIEISRLIRGLDFGRQRNDIVLPKIVGDSDWVTVSRCEILPETSEQASGTVVDISDAGMRLSTDTTDVQLTGFRDAAGYSLDSSLCSELLGLKPGQRLPKSVIDQDALDKLQGAKLNERYWAQKLPLFEMTVLPDVQSEDSRDDDCLDFKFAPSPEWSGASGQRDLIAAFWLVFVSRLTGKPDVGFSYTPGALRDLARQLPAQMPSSLPVMVSIAGKTRVIDAVASITEMLHETDKHASVLSDLALRLRNTSEEQRAAFAGRLPFGLEFSQSTPVNKGALVLRVADDGSASLAGSATEGLKRWIAARFRSFLEKSSGGASRPVEQWPLLTDIETQELVALGSGARPPLPTAATVPDMIDFESGRAAVACGDDKLDYIELDKQSLAVARALTESGVAEGDVVGVYLRRSVHLLPVMLGIWRTGAAYLPLDPAFPVDRLAYTINDAGVGLVIVDQHGSALEGHHPATEVTIDELLTLPQSGAFTEKRHPELAYILYTSGTTGRPKGVRIPHRAVINFLASMRHTPGLSPSDRLLAVTTTSFDISVLELFLPLVAGGSLTTRADINEGQTLVALLDRSNANVMQATPSTWRMLLDASWTPKPGFKVLCGGESFPPDLAQSLIELGCEVWNMYGPTETTVWSTCTLLQAGEDVTVGTPIDHTQIIVGNAAGEPQPRGVPGEIFIAGLGVAEGYHNRPELTSERFIEGPSSLPGRLYRTGDLGRWRDDGHLQHLGRIDDQVKIRGFRIELGEIESRLQEADSVSRAAVSVWEPEPGDQRLVAYVVTELGKQLIVTELRKHLRRLVPDYMLPQHFVGLDELPTTPNGKINRRALPAPQLGYGKPTSQPPVSSMEKLVASTWSSLVGVPGIGRTDNFFDLGGHSLLALKAINQLEVETGYRLRFQDILLNDLASVSTILEEQTSNDKENRSGESGVLSSLRNLIRRD